MFSNQLFDNDSDSDGNNSGFNTNKEYAKTYNKFRSKELQKKLKDKGQATNGLSDDSSSDTDSTDNETIDPKFDEAFFQTLATLKKKDSSIYDAKLNFFEEFDGKKNDGGKKSTKALTVKDYERKILLEKGGIYDDEDGDGGEHMRAASPSYNQEQMDIKNAFKKVLEEDDDESDDDWGGIFKKREKTTEEKAEEEKQYAKWLAGEKANIGAMAQELKPLKEYWDNPKLSKDEKFLRDYILSNGYSATDKNVIPTYDEIVGDDELKLSEDEAELERQAEFEQKFNFRFEEPDAEFIKRYPRTIEQSVRRVDNRRKEKRAEVKERKLQEKKEKMKELEMLNAIRKKEIEEKIQKLKEVTGDEKIQFDDDDLDGDFDPDEHDRKMQKIFNNEYYQVDEGESKPECPDIEDLKVEDWDNYDPANDDEEVDDVHCEDDEFVMDCDYDPEQQKKSLQDELIENTRDKRKRRKRQSKFAQMLKREKPVFNPDDEKTYAEYLDEYYKLDYEDIIGDTPCRFKYVETVPNDFGLTVEEILLAKNKELNCWASLKKATQIRPEHVELNEVKMFKDKAKREYLKRKILPSLYGEGSDDEEDTKVKEGEKKKNPNQKRKIKEDNIEKKPTIESAEKEKKKVETTTEKKKKKVDITTKKEKKKVETSPKKENKKVETTTKKEKKKVETATGATANPLNESKSFAIEEDIENPREVAVLEKKKQKQSSVTKAEKASVVEASPKQVPVKPAGKKSPKKPLHRKHKLEVKKTLGKANLSKKGGITKKKLKNNKVPSSTSVKKPNISDERLKAFGFNPKKFHKKLQYSNKTTVTEAPTTSNTVAPTTSKTAAIKDKKLVKMNQKKIKKKLLTALGS